MRIGNRVCFVYVPRDGKVPCIKLIPLGTIGAADYLSTNGFKLSITHLGLEKNLNLHFDLKNSL